MVIDPSELLGKRMDFQVGLVRCLGVKWLKEDAERGIQMGYRLRTPPPTSWALAGRGLSWCLKNEFITKFSYVSCFQPQNAYFPIG